MLILKIMILFYYNHLQIEDYYIIKLNNYKFLISKYQYIIQFMKFLSYKHQLEKDYI